MDSTACTSPSIKDHATVWGLIVFFFVITFLVSTNYCRYHADEWFYTDGAIEMLRNGDFLTPHYANDTLRFNKPPLTYWLVAASYRVFGVSIWSSRLPFVALGSLFLFLTYRVGLMLFGSHRLALLGMSIMASSHVLVTLAGCSITDCLYAFWILLGHYGFLRMIFKGEHRGKAAACAYLGSGLAIATRGILGLTPIIYAFMFVAIFRPEKCRLRDLIQPRWMGGCLLLGGSWIASMWYLYGPWFVDGFLKDQAGCRFHDSMWLNNIHAYPAIFLTEFLPWVAAFGIVAWKGWKPLASAFKTRQKVFLYLLGWCAAVVTMYVMGNLCRSRYLLPAFPLFALFLAAWLESASPRETLERYWRVLAWIFALLALCGGGFLALYGNEVDAHLKIGGCLLLSLAVALAALLRWTRIFTPVLLSICVIALLAISDAFVRNLSCAHPEPQVAELLARRALRKPDVAVLTSLNRKFASRLRVSAENRLQVSYRYASGIQAAAPSVVIFDETQTPALPGYEILHFKTRVQDDIDAFKLFEAWRHGDAADYLDTCTLSLGIATK